MVASESLKGVNLKKKKRNQSVLFIFNKNQNVTKMFFEGKRMKNEFGRSEVSDWLF